MNDQTPSSLALDALKLAASVRSAAIQSMSENQRNLSVELLRLRKALRSALIEIMPDDKIAGTAIARCIEQADQIERMIVEIDENAGFVSAFKSDDEQSLYEFVAQVIDSKNHNETHNQSDPIVRQAVWNLTGGKCAYCFAELMPDTSGGREAAFCIEHVVPKSKGGPDHLANYVPACFSCNASKTDNHVLHFIQRHLPRRTLTVVSGGAGQSEIDQVQALNVGGLT